MTSNMHHLKVGVWFSRAFAMIFGCRTVMLAAVGFSTIAFVTYGVGFWGAPYMIRMHDVSASEVGTFLGLGEACEFDSKCIYMAAGMIRRGDDLFMYYAGYDHRHGGNKHGQAGHGEGV